MIGKLEVQAVFLIRLYCPASKSQHKPCARTLTKRTSDGRVSQPHPCYMILHCGPRSAAASNSVS